MLRNRLKRTMSLLLALIMAFSMLPASAFAAESAPFPTDADNFYSTGCFRRENTPDAYMVPLDASEYKYGIASIRLDMTSNGAEYDWNKSEELSKLYGNYENMTVNDYTSFFVKWYEWATVLNKIQPQTQRPIGIRIIEDHYGVLAEYGEIAADELGRQSVWSYKNNTGPNPGDPRQDKITGASSQTGSSQIVVPTGYDENDFYFLQAKNVRPAQENGFHYDSKKGAYIDDRTGVARVVSFKEAVSFNEAGNEVKTFKPANSPDLLGLGVTTANEPVYYMKNHGGPGTDVGILAPVSYEDRVQGCYGKNGKPCTGSYDHSMSDGFLISVPITGASITLEFTYEVTSPNYFGGPNFGGRNDNDAVMPPSDYATNSNRWHDNSTRYIWFLSGEYTGGMELSDGTDFTLNKTYHWMITTPEIGIIGDNAKERSRNIVRMAINNEPACRDAFGSGTEAVNRSVADGQAQTLVGSIPRDENTTNEWWTSPVMTLGMNNHNSVFRINNNLGILVQKKDASNTSPEIPLDVSLQMIDKIPYLNSFSRLFYVASGYGQSRPQDIKNDAWAIGKNVSTVVPMRVNGWAKFWIQPNFAFRIAEMSEGTSYNGRHVTGGYNLNDKNSGDFQLYGATTSSELSDFYGNLGVGSRSENGITYLIWVSKPHEPESVV